MLCNPVRLSRQNPNYTLFGASCGENWEEVPLVGFFSTLICGAHIWERIVG